MYTLYQSSVATSFYILEDQLPESNSGEAIEHLCYLYSVLLNQLLLFVGEDALGILLHGGQSSYRPPAS